MEAPKQQESWARIQAWIPTYAERMQAKYGTSFCGHCGRDWDECVGAEGCWT